MFPPILRLFAAASVLLFSTVVALPFSFDDDIPEITDRVARITFIRGDVQIRRADTEEWERAVSNLPIVEGDEIVSDGGGRFEIQFSKGKFLRADERTSVRMLTLRDEGIALSVPQGNVSVRLKEFDSSAQFFEIDAPETTIALQAVGVYRIDAGRASEVRISIFDEGEARIYSATSGFTLRSGRTARVYTDGSYRGEWELANSSQYDDEFDEWARDRDERIADRLRRAHYGNYYDEDIYGADELSDHGDWIYTRDYGYVWRPWRSSVSSYADWSPYRYGHWRWIPPFGWTWVNDEPWGWATYHYGRWVWYNGYWHWSPYGYQRYSRSWWRPALVVFTQSRDNYCWYPLPYYSPYYNYNYHYYSQHHRNRPRRGGGGAPNPTPPQQPVPPVNTPILTNEERRARMTTPPFQRVPPGGVVSLPVEEFGRQRSGTRTPPLATAREVLSKLPDAGETPPILPDLPEVRRKMSSEIKGERPAVIRSLPTAKTGAETRKTDEPLDRSLRSTRILGNRPPLQINTPQGDVKNPVEPARPRTGAVERPANPTPPIYAPLPDKGKPAEEPRSRPSFPQQQQRRVEPVSPQQKPRDEQPQYEPPRRREPPLQRSEPRYEPPPTKRDEPRPSPPIRETPRPAPPPQKSDPPPQKSEPTKPSPTPPLSRKGDQKDN